jgi:MerR HTH family regulatory protein
MIPMRYLQASDRPSRLTLDHTLEWTIFSGRRLGMSQVLYIGQVAQDTGLSVHAIRFYEREA